MRRSKGIQKKVKTRKNRLLDFSQRFDEFLRKQKRINCLAFNQAVEALDSARMRAAFEDLVDVVELLKGNLGFKEHAAELQVEPKPQAKGIPAYVVSSWFLLDCYKWLTRSRTEELCFVTGVEQDEKRHLERRCEFQMAAKSASGAEGDLASMARALLEMDKFGHRFLAHFHSHPFEGAAGTLPSSTDRDFQQRLEKGKYQAIGAIFSRDGYVRFFANGNPFNVIVFGKGVEDVEDKVFKLVGVE